MGKVEAVKWVEWLKAEGFGRVVPEDPVKVLSVLGALLRANPTEKDRFVEDAYRAWVGGGWDMEVGSREDLVILAALEEATRRLAEKYGWKREKEKEVERVDLGEGEYLSRIRVVRKREEAPEGTFLLFVGERFSHKSLWAAAYRVVEGGEVCLLGPMAEKVVPILRKRVAKLLATRPSRKNSPNPYELVERARVQLAGMLEEGEEEEFEVVEEREWAHQTRVNAGLVRKLLPSLDPEAGEVELEYILQDDSFVREVLNLLDGVEVDVYAVPSRRPRKGAKGAWQARLAWLVKRELGEEEWRKRCRKGGWSLIWALLPLIALPVAQGSYKDPESVFHNLTLWAKEWWDKKKGKKVEEVFPYFLNDLRARGALEFARERGKISREEVRRALKAFREGRFEESLASLFPLSVEEMREVGAEVVGEVDYDALLLRRKVEELREEVRQVWGPEGLRVFEVLEEGVTLPVAHVVAGVRKEVAEQVVGYLREELAPWAEA